MLPKPPGLNLWGKKQLDEGLDNAKRFLHVTAGALVLEVEGDDEVRGGTEYKWEGSLGRVG